MKKREKAPSFADSIIDLTIKKIKSVFLNHTDKLIDWRLLSNIIMKHSTCIISCFIFSSTIAQTIESKLIDAVAKSDITYLQKNMNNSNSNTINKKKQSLLMMATYDNNLQVAKILVDKGADVNFQNTMKDSPFLYASASGYFDLVKLYLENGARFNIYNRYGGTGLIPAAEKGHIETVHLLANTPNYPINHINNLGWTALLETIILGDGSEKYNKIVRILLAAGADKNIADKHNSTPLDHARRKGYKEMIRLLE